MKNGTSAGLILAAGILLFAGFAAVTFMLSEEKTENFGITSTKLTMLVGEESDLSVWDVPDGVTFDSIIWSSSDPEIVSVFEGKITANGLGQAVITAKVSAGGEDYSDRCTVTVASERESQLTAYDAYSGSMDYAVLSGPGFENGLLSLTFNYGGNTVIALAGYDPSWLSLGFSKVFIGNPVTDFNQITMTISQGGNIIASTVFSGKDGDAGHNDGSKNCNDHPYSPLIAVSKLGYGTYDVTFEIEYGFITSKTVNGSFEYCRGDGLRDASGSFIRSYAWVCDNGGLLPGQKATRSFTLEYSYADYFDAYMKNSRSVKEGSKNIYNSGKTSEAPGFVTESYNVKLLSEKLKEDYTAAYGLTDYTTQHFAQYILTFVQTQYCYDYDNTQNYRFGNKWFDHSDYWAYSDETIYSGTGDCEDTSILLASIYGYFGFHTALIELPGHMMAAISLEEFTDYSGFTSSAEIFKAWYEGETYYFCETTTDAPVIETRTDIAGNKVKTYFDKPVTEKTSGSLARYSYYYTLVGSGAKNYIGYEFTLIPV